MKRSIISLMLMCSLVYGNVVIAQSFDQLDPIPMDISYLTTKTVKEPLVKVVYGRPHKTAEKVFGDQVPYGEIWRTGANEATEVKFFKDMLFGKKLIKAGTYVLHTIPGEKEWTIILNSNTDTWGAFFYDETKDVARIKISPNEAELIEVFSIEFKESFKNTFMVLAWDDTQVNIPLSTQDAVLAKI